MVMERVEHPWLGSLRRYGEDQLLGSIEVDPAIRPARLNGERDAEVLITVGSPAEGSELDIVLALATERIQAALADLDNIKAFGITHAPGEWRRHYEAIDPIPLTRRLFLEGFAVLSPAEMEISFDYGDLDMLVVRVDAEGRGQDVSVVA
jgi:hypothetical protein